MAMDPGQRGFGQPMRPQGPVDRLDESIGERSRNMPFADRLKRLFPQGELPPDLLQMLMAQLMSGQGNGMVGPRQAAQRAQQGGRRPLSGRPPMGGPQRGGQRPPMGGGRPPMGRPPMGGLGGGGRPPVVKIEDLVRALSSGGGQRPAPQANMAVPQARR